MLNPGTARRSRIKSALKIRFRIKYFFASKKLCALSDSKFLSTHVPKIVISLKLRVEISGGRKLRF